MVKASLVDSDIELGSRIVKALDEAGLRPDVALWVFLARYEDWRLLFASRELEAKGFWEGYGLVLDALRRAGFSYDQTPSYILLQMTDPFVRGLRRIFGKTKSVAGMRLGGQLIGNQFVEDAYVYRIK